MLAESLGALHASRVSRHGSLKSTHQVKILFDLLPPCDPDVPVDGKWRAGDFFFFAFFRRRCETSRGHVVLVEERQVGVEFTPQYRYMDAHARRKTAKRKFVVPEMCSV